MTAMVVILPGRRTRANRGRPLLTWYAAKGPLSGTRYPGGSITMSWSPPGSAAGGTKAPRMRPPVPSETKSTLSRTPNILRRKPAPSSPAVVRSDDDVAKFLLEEGHVTGEMAMTLQFPFPTEPPQA